MKMFPKISPIIPQRRPDIFEHSDWVYVGPWPKGSSPLFAFCQRVFNPPNSRRSVALAYQPLAIKFHGVVPEDFSLCFVGYGMRIKIGKRSCWFHAVSMRIVGVPYNVFAI